MAFKVIVSLLALATLTSAGVVPAVPAGVVVKAEEYDPHPQYSYGYDVQDYLTGDSKAHSETRDGDVVRGQYSLIDPDGTRRVVDYVADPINGFNAVVRKEALVAPAVAAAAPVATPVAAGDLPTVVDARAVAAPAVVAQRTVLAPAAPAVVAAKTIAAPFAAPIATPFAAPIATPFAAPLAAPYAAPFAAPLAARFAQPLPAVAAPALAYSALPAPVQYSQLAYSGLPLGYSGLANPYAFARLAAPQYAPVY